MMEYILCSKEFKDFFNILNSNNNSIDNMVVHLRRAICHISKQLHLGRLDISFTSPVSIYEPNGIHENIEVYKHIDGCSEYDKYSKEYQTEKKEHAIFCAYPTIEYIWTESEQQALAFLFDNLFVFMEHARLLELKRKAIITDAMTGMPNTTGLMQFGERLMQQNVLSEYTGMYINIKNFKFINKSLGSRQGDLFLREYCHTINSFLKNDEIFARLGGDNFIALIKNTSVEPFLDYISNISLSGQVNGETVDFDIEARIGVYPTSKGETMQDIMNGATIAFNIARKSTNHNYIWFRPQMMEKIMHTKEISSVFPSALRNHEFTVYYQPKVLLSNNSLCGCEALVRWIKDGKIMSPMDFIPVLEQEGTICKLDFYVLEQVCQDLRRWLDSGINPVKISVNFSKIHLHNKKLATDIISIIEKYDINTKYIEIELTEMSGYEDYTALSVFVNDMKRHGISTSIDDFGTGYSSLNLLKDLNVDIIKLDKSFLNIEARSKNEEIVIRNIINMINELEMEAIAEGVETTEQADFLKDVNCHMAQGFLYDRPLPHDEFEIHLTENRIYEIQN